MKTPTPNEIRAIRTGLDLSARRFGEALGLADAERTVRAWEHGTRNDKPFRITGSALKALEYLLVVRDILDGWASEEGEGAFDDAMARAVDLLPKRGE